MPLIIHSFGISVYFVYIFRSSWILSGIIRNIKIGRKIDGQMIDG